MDRFIYKAKTTPKDNLNHSFNDVWIEGDLIISGGKYYIHPRGNAVTVEGELGKLIVMHEVDPTTVCQCTGVKDKNGKPIWENDICDRKEEYPEIVKYYEGQWILDYSYASGKEVGTNYCGLGFYAYEREVVEVIGNIFDSPELLKQ